MPDYTCHRCGAEVEAGAPFCKQCGAPQIRVSVSEQQPVTPPLEPGTPGELQPPAEPVRLPEHGAAVSPPFPAVPESVDWSDALPGALAAGALLALSWVIPFIGFLLWLVAAGALAVVFYARRKTIVNLTAGLGARIGAVTGLLGFGIFALLMSLELLATRGTGKLRQMLQQVMQQAVASNPDPNAQQVIQNLMTPQGIALLVTFVMVLFFACFLAFGALGGVFGASLLRKRAKR